MMMTRNIHKDQRNYRMSMNKLEFFVIYHFFTFHFDNYSLFCNHFEWEVLAVALELKYFVFFRKYVGIFILRTW